MERLVIVVKLVVVEYDVVESMIVYVVAARVEVEVSVVVEYCILVEVDVVVAKEYTVLTRVNVEVVVTNAVWVWGGWESQYDILTQHDEYENYITYLSSRRSRSDGGGCLWLCNAHRESRR